MIKMIFALGLLAGFALGCSSAPKECAFGKPSAVFDPKNAAFAQHQFQSNGQSAQESVQIPEMNLAVELLQSGCDTLRQEIRLTLNGTINHIQTAPQCAELVAEILYDIGQYDPKNLGLLPRLASAIGHNRARFQYGEPVGLVLDEVPFQVSLHRTPDGNRTLLSVELIAGQ